MRTLLERRPLLLLASILLALFAAAYAARGYVIYFGILPVADFIPGCDALTHWREEHYVFRGQNPYDVMFAHMPGAAAFQPPAQVLVNRNAMPDPILGIPTSNVVSPPWAFSTMAPVFALPLRWSAPFYALLMLAGLSAVGVWAYRQGRPWGLSTAVFLAAAALALGSWCSAIFTGNYPLLIIPLLIGVLCLTEKNRPILAGLLLGLAVIKPTLGGPFALALLMHRRFTSLAVAAAWMVAASLITWWAIATNPVEILSQMFAASRGVLSAVNGPARYAIAAGADPVVATKISGLIAGVLGTLALFLARRQNLLTLFAIAAVTARFWMYRFVYDESILLFLLVALALAALRSRSHLATAAFLAVGMSLWMPARLTDHLAFQLFQQCTWATGVIVLLIWGQGWEQTSPTLSPPRPATLAPARQTPPPSQV